MDLCDLWSRYTVKLWAKNKIRNYEKKSQLPICIFFHFKDRLFIVPGLVNGLKPILWFYDCGSQFTLHLEAKNWPMLTRMWKALYILVDCCFWILLICFTHVFLIGEAWFMLNYFGYPSHCLLWFIIALSSVNLQVDLAPALWCVHTKS